MAYIFFDIDGTLWDEKMQIPESTIPTIKHFFDLPYNYYQ